MNSEAKAEGRKDDGRGDLTLAAKLRYDLIPVMPLADLAEVYTVGAAKYNDRNWEQGIKFSRILAAMFRHLESFRAGEDKDKESGCYHLASVAWGAFALLEYTRTHPDLDDRILFETSIDREEQLNRELAEAARELRIAMVQQMAEQLMEEFNAC